MGKRWSELVPSSEDANICTPLFFILSSTGVNARDLLEGKNEPKVTAERINDLVENAPWASPSKIDEYLRKIVGDILGAEFQITNVDKPKKDELEHMRSEVEREHCPSLRCKRFRAGKGVDQEDLSLAIQVSKLGRDGLHIFSVGEECFGCVSLYLKGKGRLKAHLEPIKR